MGDFGVHKETWPKMNPSKCAFRVSAGEFLDFMVHERGIEVGEKSMKAIEEAAPPTNKT